MNEDDAVSISCDLDHPDAVLISVGVSNHSSIEIVTLILNRYAIEIFVDDDVGDGDGDVFCSVDDRDNPDDRGGLYVPDVLYVHRVHCQPPEYQLQWVEHHHL